MRALRWWRAAHYTNCSNTRDRLKRGFRPRALSLPRATLRRKRMPGSRYDAPLRLFPTALFRNSYKNRQFVASIFDNVAVKQRDFLIYSRVPLWPYLPRLHSTSEVNYQAEIIISGITRVILKQNKKKMEQNFFKRSFVFEIIGFENQKIIGTSVLF